MKHQSKITWAVLLILALFTACNATKEVQPVKPFQVDKDPRTLRAEPYPSRVR